MKSKTLFFPTGAPLKIRGKYRGFWPPPVYVATFADGTIGKTSFYSPIGKPIDFQRAREAACWLWRNDWPLGTTPRRDVIAGHVELGGESSYRPADSRPDN